MTFNEASQYRNLPFFILDRENSYLHPDSNWWVFVLRLSETWYSLLINDRERKWRKSFNTGIMIYYDPISFEEVLENVSPETQRQLLFHLDLFR